MLINEEHMDTTEHVKFISYTGRWPNLCTGILTLEIDGEKHTFGAGHKWCQNLVEPMHPKFWGFDCTDIATKSEWAVDVQKLPEQFRKHAAEIDNVMNVNVDHPHCGGCR